MRIPISNKVKLVLTFILCLGLGVFAAHFGSKLWPIIKQGIYTQPAVYITPDKALMGKYTQSKVQTLDWVSLLPAKEHEIIARYQAAQPQNLEDMTAQILRAINASTDQSYQDALISTNTVSLLEDKMVTISGFIVPIDFYQDKSVKSLFFVPYFGACIHFPAPPPNQMIFAEIKQGLSNIDIAQAHTLTGEIAQGLFEDPLGTSAYILDVVSITKFDGQPDNFRKH